MICVVFFNQSYIVKILTGTNFWLNPIKACCDVPIFFHSMLLAPSSLSSQFQLQVYDGLI